MAPNNGVRSSFASDGIKTCSAQYGLLTFFRFLRETVLSETEISGIMVLPLWSGVMKLKRARLVIVPVFVLTVLEHASHEITNGLNVFSGDKKI